MTCWSPCSVGFVVASVCTVSIFFFFSSRRRHTRFDCDWSSDVCSSDLVSTDHGRTTVKVVLPHSGHGGEADLHVQVPKDSELTVSAGSGVVTTARVTGVLRLYTVSGCYTAQLCRSGPEPQSLGSHSQRNSSD